MSEKNTLELFCNRCHKPLVKIEALDSILIINTCEALCLDCSQIRRGSELMVKDNVEEIKRLQARIAEQEKVLFSGAYL